MKPTRTTHKDPKWRYTMAEETDIRKTFARVRKQAQEQSPPIPPNVTTLRKTAK